MKLQTEETEKLIYDVGRTNVTSKTNVLVKTSILAVIAYLLMLIEIPVFFFPDFLRIDASDIPAIIGGFAFGPITGVAIEGIKNLIKFATGSWSGGIGELANFIVGTAWVLPAAIIYKRRKKRKTALYGMAIGIFSMVIVGALVNFFVLIPLYLPGVDAKSIVLYSIIPFNLFKGVVITLITMVIYKKISPVLHK